MQGFGAIFSMEGLAFTGSCLDQTFEIKQKQLPPESFYVWRIPCKKLGTGDFKSLDVRLRVSSLGAEGESLLNPIGHLGSLRWRYGVRRGNTRINGAEGGSWNSVTSYRRGYHPIYHATFHPANLPHRSPAL